MSAFNICTVRPSAYRHSAAFDELAELLLYSLKELGHDVTMASNKLEAKAKNILIGCHLLSPDFISSVPPSTVVLNTEQIYSDDTAWNHNIFEWAERFELWDYSHRNISKFADKGIKAKHLKLGFQKELQRIEKRRNPDIDILFYGSRNDRRNRVLDALKSRGLRVEILFGVYGAERDAYISRSKIVINHHLYNSHIFEVVRVFYLLTNRVAVVGEVNGTTSIEDMYRSAVHCAAYENLVDACEDLVRDDARRQALEAGGHEAIMRHPQRLFTAAVI